MQKTENQHQAAKNRRKVRSSTTLNRKYVQKPSHLTNNEIEIAAQRSAKIRHLDISTSESIENAAQRSAKIRHFNISTPDVSAPESSLIPAAKAPRRITIQDDEPIAPPEIHPLQATAIKRMQNQNTAPEEHRLTAREIKDQAIQKALATSAKSIEKQNAAQAKKEKKAKLHFGVGRVVLALTCAAAAVFAIVYFVGLNMPDITMRVAAMQTGIEASYPSYVPRGFNLSDITSESGKVVLNFQNEDASTVFSLSEENSSWDSNALLSNFVKNEYGEDYTIIREQGLTIYISKSDAAWVNGGVVYKLKTDTGELTKKQISSIAVSL